MIRINPRFPVGCYTNSRGDPEPRKPMSPQRRREIYGKIRPMEDKRSLWEKIKDLFR